MKRSEGIKYLTQCADRQGRHWYQGIEWTDIQSCPTCHGTNDAGWLRVPCSRYGGTSAECAEVTWRFNYLVTKERGDPVNRDNLDLAMGLVVNDHEDVAYVIRTYGHGMYR